MTGWQAPAAAQSRLDWETLQRIDQRYAEQEGRITNQLIAQNDGIAASLAYAKENWNVAFERGQKACEGNSATGCVVLGQVLAEGRVGTPDARGAEAAHRKAASLYADGCKDTSFNSDTCAAAGDFHAVNAVPALRNERLARTYYTRARDGYTRACNSFTGDCEMAGILTEGDYAGRPDPAGAVRLWRRGCEADDRSDAFLSCNKLVESLAYGPAGVQNQAEARKLIEADQCSVAAPGNGGTRQVDRLYCAIVAEFLFDGIGGPADPELAERLMRYSCEDGQESACASLETRGLGRDDMKAAMALRDLGLMSGARDRFETLCTARNRVACNEAGRIYNREDNADSKAKALHLYDQACKLGYIIGCANQGSTLVQRGGQANFTAARAALGKACDAKDGQACGELGRLLALGRGGPTDQPGAVRLYEVACNDDDSNSCFYLAQSYTDGLGVPADPSRGRAIYEKSCTLGSIGGCNNFASSLERGRGGPTDLVRARSIYERICNNNKFPASCNSLGRFKRDGLGGPADPAAARALFDKACSRQAPEACNNLSDSLLSSAGGPTDRKKAITLRRIACLVYDNQNACTWLAEGGHSDPAEDGIILANNNMVDRALPLLRTACDAGNPRGCVGLAAFTPRDAMSNSERVRLSQKACALGDAEGCAAARQFQER